MKRVACLLVLLALSCCAAHRVAEVRAAMDVAKAPCQTIPREPGRFRERAVCLNEAETRVLPNHPYTPQVAAFRMKNAAEMDRREITPEEGEFRITQFVAELDRRERDRQAYIQAHTPPPWMAPQQQEPEWILPPPPNFGVQTSCYRFGNMVNCNSW